MGRKRTKATEGDRAVYLSTGETATIVAVHAETTPKGSPPNYSVLLDTGPRRTKLWKGADCEWEYPTQHACYRCGDTGHTAIQCPYGDLGHHLTTEGRAALVKAGLDPRRLPGRVDAPDEYNGISVTTLAGGDRPTLYHQMRRRVCELDGVVVDGHGMIDGTCEHCGGTA